tara:strand:+ start:3097 stop:3456 length:360 start_codon:yes stop_codon:yes gene_type:complete
MTNEETKHLFYCEGLEKYYEDAVEQGLFEVLKVLDLDEEHSDKDLVEAVAYFKDKNGVIEKDAPMGFLSEQNKRMVTLNGSFRAGLYCMLLSSRFSESIEEKSSFVAHTTKYSFDSEYN